MGGERDFQVPPTTQVMHMTDASYVSMLTVKLDLIMQHLDTKDQKLDGKYLSVI